MRNMLILLAAVALLAPARVAPAQEASLDAPPPDAFLDGPPPEDFGGEPPHAGPGPGFEPGEPPPFKPEGREPGPPAERWLQHLREKNPEEFDRLSRMREEDPEAFREALRKRLWRERERHGMRGGFGRMPPSPEIERAEQEAHELARQYRAAATPDEKAAIRQPLRAKLEEIFELREREREERIRQIERQLQTLQQTMEKRAARRSEIIDRRLEQMTEGDPLAW